MFAFVLTLAFILLLVSFRSIVIAAKAIVLNLLSVAAAYGVLVIVFQWGWGESLLNFRSNGGIASWLPIFLFVILFGLSMDYHVFILSRIREAFDRGMKTEDAVAHGIKTTAGVVTSAAVVMVGVFSIFATLPILDMKELGIGLAAAVLIDATIVRAVLLPAAMKLLGDWNWYLPSWLGWLPRLDHGAGRVSGTPDPGARIDEERTSAASTGRGRREAAPAVNASSVTSVARPWLASGPVQTLRRTPLYERHVAAGARLVPFAGWEMPVQYEGVIAEHKAVRTGAGVFDVSHMGEIEIEGPTAADLLQSVLSNDVSRLGEGDAQYTLLTNEQGGIVDDLIVYRTGPCRYLLVVNAANRETDFEWLARARAPRLGRARRLRRVRPARGPGAAGARPDRHRARACVHVGDGRGRRGRGDGEPHRLHGRGGRRAGVPARGRAGALGRDRRRRRHAVRARRARHAAPRGLLPAARQRHRAAMGRDLERPRLGVRARHRLHRRRRPARRQGERARAQARRVPDDRAGDPAAGNDDRGRRRGDLGLAVTHARPGDRARLRSRFDERARAPS